MDNLVSMKELSVKQMKEIVKKARQFKEQGIPAMDKK